MEEKKLKLAIAKLRKCDHAGIRTQNLYQLIRYRKVTRYHCATQPVY